MKTRLAVLLLVAALIAWALSSAPTPPPPAPAPPAAIDLVGAFQGATAADDAATLAAMADEIANVIEWDGKQETPALKTGRMLDELRTRTREFMCRGVSLGEKHPAARTAIGAYLDEQLGNGGGEVSQEQRAKWASAYREIARSARHAIAQ
jgi:hypothetical protein